MFKFRLLFLLIIPIILYSTPPTVIWSGCFGGSSDEKFREIHESYAGGYIAAGYTNSIDGDIEHNNGLYDCWLVKLDDYGNIEWSKCYGGTDNDQLSSILPLSDGYIFTGRVQSNDGDITEHFGLKDIWVVRTKLNGEIMWQRCFGGTGDDWPNCITNAFDRTFIVSGYTRSNDYDVEGNHGGKDFWIFKINDSGNLIWETCIGGSLDDESWSVIQCPDSSILAFGHSNSNDFDILGNHGLRDYQLVKLNNSGELLWSKSIGGSIDDTGYSVGLLSDGNILVAGKSYSSDFDIPFIYGATDICIMKLSEDGDIIWSNNYGGYQDDVVRHIEVTPDDNIVIGGETFSYNCDITANYGGLDQWLLMIDSNGNILWDKNIGGTRNDWGFYVDYDSEGNFLIAGGSQSSDHDAIGYHGNMDALLTLLSYDSYHCTETNNQVPGNCCITVFPNPFNGNCKIIGNEIDNIRIVDAAGRIISDNLPEEFIFTPKANSPSGIYYVVGNNNSQIIKKKIFYIK